MTILIADDDPMMLRIVELKLKKEGYQVITTVDGREALKAIETHTFDLIVTDIMMPFYSGLDVVAKVKSSNKRIPVIVLSAIDKDDAVMEAFKLGADDFLKKPFSPAELLLHVNRLLPVQEDYTMYK